MAELKTYDEVTHELIENPDLENGYVYLSRIQVGMTEERYEVMEGTVEVYPPDGLKRYYPPEPIYEDCYFYHKYAEGEKSTPIPTPTPTSTPSPDEVWDDMAKAYRDGVNSI